MEVSSRIEAEIVQFIELCPKLMTLELLDVIVMKQGSITVKDKKNKANTRKFP